MAKKFFQTEDFKKLQNEWYGKLENEHVETKTKVKKNGLVRTKREFDFFIDIENGRDTEVIEPQIFSEDKHQYDGGTDYRNFCEQILTEYKFKFEVDKIIFQKHTQGLSDRQIATWLKLQGTFHEYSYQGINVILNRIKESFKLGK